MTQKELDLVYNITILIYENEWFKAKERTRDEVQEWVREQLEKAGILSWPVGMSWGMLCSPELLAVFKANEEEYKQEKLKLQEEHDRKRDIESTNRKQSSFRNKWRLLFNRQKNR